MDWFFVVKQIVVFRRVRGGDSWCLRYASSSRLVLCVESTTARMTLTLTLVAWLHLWRRSSMLRRDRGGVSWSFSTRSDLMPQERICNTQWSRLSTSQCARKFTTRMSELRNVRKCPILGTSHVPTWRASMGYTSWCGLSRPWAAPAIRWQCRFFRDHVRRDMAQLGAVGPWPGPTRRVVNITSKPPPPPPPPPPPHTPPPPPLHHPPTRPHTHIHTHTLHPTPPPPPPPPHPTLKAASFRDDSFT